MRTLNVQLPAHQDQIFGYSLRFLEDLTEKFVEVLFGPFAVRQRMLLQRPGDYVMADNRAMYVLPSLFLAIPVAGPLNTWKCPTLVNVSRKYILYNSTSFIKISCKPGYLMIVFKIFLRISYSSINCYQYIFIFTAVSPQPPKPPKTPGTMI